MKGPLHAIRRRRSERPANGVDTAQAATEAPTEAQPTAGLASAPPPPAADQAPPDGRAARRRPPAEPRRRRRGPRRPGAGARPPELPPARPPAPAPALPAPRPRAGLPRPRRPRLRPAPLLAGQRRRSCTASSRRWAPSTRELRALEHALDDRRPLTELREPGVSVCSRCGALHGSEARFCPSCGTPVHGPRAIAEVGEAVSLPAGESARSRRRRPPRARAAPAARPRQPRAAHRRSRWRRAPSGSQPAPRRRPRRAPAEPEQRRRARRARRPSRRPPDGEQPTEVMRPVDEEAADRGRPTARPSRGPADRRAPRAVSVAPPGAPPAPGTIACPRCATTIGPDQDWCLACGAPARTRLVPTPNWRAPVAVLAVVVLLAGIALAVAFVSLTNDNEPAAPVNSQAPPPSATTHRTGRRRGRAHAAPPPTTAAPRARAPAPTTRRAPRRHHRRAARLRAAAARVHLRARRSGTHHRARASATPARGRRSEPSSRRTHRGPTERPAQAASSRDDAHQRPAPRQPPRGLRGQRVQRHGGRSAGSSAPTHLERRHRRLGQRLEVVAALEHDADRHVELVGQAAHARRHLRVALAGHAAARERIAHVRVEAGRDEDQARAVLEPERDDDVLDQRAPRRVARARRHGQVDRVALPRPGARVAGRPRARDTAATRGCSRRARRDRGGRCRWSRCRGGRPSRGSGRARRPSDRAPAGRPPRRC